MKHAIFLALFSFLMACSDDSALADVREKAQSAWQKMAGSRCANDGVIAQILNESGYMFEHPVRGRTALEDVSLSVENIRETQQQNDRIVCSAELVAKGPRMAMARHLLTHDAHADAAFVLQEQSAGWNDLAADVKATEGSIFGEAMAHAGVAVQISLTLLRTDDADDPTPVPFRSPLEFAVTPDGIVELIAWLWIPGSSPNWHAARALRAVSESKLSPS